MLNWSRAHTPGGSFFFTVVTDQRRPLFADDNTCRLLGDVVRECRQRWPFDIHSIVLLPDHLHAFWCLLRGDDGYSMRWACMKRQFTKRWLSTGGTETSVTESRQCDGRRGVWQPKFWEHTLEDEGDFERHVVYIHYNPVKHGDVRCPREWPWSSSHRWVKHGADLPRWGCIEHDPQVKFDDIEESVGK